MKHCLHFLLFLFSSLGYVVIAQTQEEDWRKYVSQMAEEGIDNSSVENIYEELLYIENNPMDLNTVTRLQLENFPLLSREEANAIVTFLEKNRPIYTVFELRNVPYLEYNKVAMIIPFFYVGTTLGKEPKVHTSDMLKKGRHEVQIRLDKTLTPRAGYSNFPDSVLQNYPNRKYMGEDFYTSLRYSFRYGKKVEAGFTAEKDAGEPFFKSKFTKGYDHYGFHFLIRNTGIFKMITLGDYRLSFGQGLVLNNDFMISKSWSTANVTRRTQLPKRHFSTAENGFFRGAAGVAGVGYIVITGFYSNKLIDANLSDAGDITSFKVDGLHRTPSEIEKKKNSREVVVGANMNFRKENIQAGVSAVYHRYNRAYNPSQKEYNRYYLRGKSHFNASIDYSYQLPGMVLAGETALGRNGAIATVNSLQYRHSSNLSLSLLHRYYPVSYNALLAQAFSEGSKVQNEQGIYIGATVHPFARITVSTYADFTRFPWLKYNVDAPSKAIDLYFLGSYALSRRSTWEVRYKYKQKEKNMAWPDKKSRSVLPYSTHKVRLRYSHERSNGWLFRTTADLSHYGEKHFPKEKGYMLSQNVGYRGKSKFSGDFYLAWFDANSYNTRLYSYERNLLNTFYMPSFYGKGYRMACSAKYTITPRLTLSVKAGHTHYSNRHTIGNGTERIDGNSRTDVFAYLRWSF